MKKYIEDTVKETIKKAGKFYNIKFENIPINFDLKGKCAGQFRFIRGFSDPKTMYFRFNMPMAESVGKKEYKQTIIHETAHYIARYMAGGSYIKPHGKEWKGVMSALGVEAKRCHDYQVPASSRTMRYFDYKCDCQTHSVSAIIHNRMQKGQKRFCKKCKAFLVKV